MSAARKLLLPAAGCATLLVGVVFRNVSYHAPAVRAALETMMTLFALAAAWLLGAQFTQSRRCRDLLMAIGVGALGLATLGANALPAALELHPRGQFAAAGLWSLLVVGGILATAAFVPSICVVPKRRVLAVAAGLTVAAVLVTVLASLLLVRQVVGGTSPGLKITMLAHPLGLFLAVVDSAFLICAAIGFQRTSVASADQIATLLSIAAVLLGASTIYHLAAGSVAPEQITPGEGLRTLAFAVLLIAAVRGEFQGRAQLARAAALAERQRVARDLHDGLAQDLALIAAHGRGFAAEMGDDHPIVIAATRALAVSRGAISELSNPEGATLDEALEAMAYELKERFDVAIVIDAQLDADVNPQAREDLTRIAREAVANAARHGGARNVIVSLKRADTGIALRVVDDGCGIRGKNGAAPREGFGLCSMRERAAALGGRLTVDHGACRGTELEVILP